MVPTNLLTSPSRLRETAEKTGKHLIQPAFLALPKRDEVFQRAKGLFQRFLSPQANPSPGKKEEPKKIDQRTAPRLPVRTKVLAHLLRPKTADRPLTGEVMNLGKKGACIETPHPLELSNVILLDFNSPGKRRFQTAARVVWCKDKISGLEFLDPVGIEYLLNSIKR